MPAGPAMRLALSGSRTWPVALIPSTSICRSPSKPPGLRRPRGARNLTRIRQCSPAFSCQRGPMVASSDRYGSYHDSRSTRPRNAGSGSDATSTRRSKRVRRASWIGSSTMRPLTVASRSSSAGGSCRDIRHAPCPSSSAIPRAAAPRMRITPAPRHQAISPAAPSSPTHHAAGSCGSRVASHMPRVNAAAVIGDNGGVRAASSMSDLRVRPRRSGLPSTCPRAVPVRGRAGVPICGRASPAPGWSSARG